jgi:hypothetical protein
MGLNPTFALASATICAVLATCGPTQPAPSQTSPHAQIASGPEGTAQLCKEVLNGVQQDTQTLVDLSYDINPANEKHYVGPNQDCYDAIEQQLAHPK